MRPSLRLSPTSTARRCCQHYRGPVDNTGKVTADLLFRGGLPGGQTVARRPAYFAGETAGPYLSQLAMIPTSLGALQIDQKITPFQAGHDFMTTLGDWYNVQQGIAPAGNLAFASARRFMSTRPGSLPPTPTWTSSIRPISSPIWCSRRSRRPPIPACPTPATRCRRRSARLGGPDATGVLGLVARAAINAVWYQKWVVNLRHRPEAGGGLVHLRKTNATPLPQAAAAFSPDFLSLIEPAIEASAARYSTSPNKTYLLSQAFPEGSPTHPAYPTGHGAVAGACITALKFFFDGIDTDHRPARHAQAASGDGSSLADYTGADASRMTVNGELHKLAHNVSFGHGIHGGHPLAERHRRVDHLRRTGGAQRPARAGEGLFGEHQRNDPDRADGVTGDHRELGSAHRVQAADRGLFVPVAVLVDEPGRPLGEHLGLQPQALEVADLA